jgi:hypothetical protein
LIPNPPNISCVFSRQIWFIILQKFGLQAFAPQTDNHSFDDWWEQASKRVDGQNKKGLNSVIILVAWMIWNHLNGCVFDGRRPDLNGLLTSVLEEAHMWELAGAQGLAHKDWLTP